MVPVDWCTNGIGLYYSMANITVDTCFHIILPVNWDWDGCVESNWFGIGIDHYVTWWTGHPGEVLILTDVKCTGAIIFQ